MVGEPVVAMVDESAETHRGIRSVYKRKTHLRQGFGGWTCPLKPTWYCGCRINEKPTVAKAMVGVSGERGIRTPGPLTVNGFQDRRIRPLCHLSGAKVRFA